MTVEFGAETAEEWGEAHERISHTQNSATTSPTSTTMSEEGQSGQKFGRRR
ncbi:hypothetical protein [Streptomyces sp. NPDC091027]|uniref:hypothetical protein n=1 Tax=Streptomyces sp. NPDC091027 TaxID=3365971 RepID=UPI0037F95EEB